MPWGETRGQNVYKYLQIVYIGIFDRISLWSHNFITFYTRKLKFCMLLIQT